MSAFPVKVQVIDSTELLNAYHGSKICVNQELHIDDYGDIYETYAEFDEEDMEKYLKTRIKEGHESIIEHAVVVVEISAVSRAFLQQLARHRHLSLSVQSTRWAMKSVIESSKGLEHYILPNEIAEDEKIQKWLKQGNKIIKQCRDTHGNDVAKYLLPEATATKILATANMREWRHIYKIRKDPPAMKEFNVFCERLYSAFERSFGTYVAELIFST